MTENKDLIAALEVMIETFDHTGLRGLVESSKKHGWKAEDSTRMWAACYAAHHVLKRHKPEHNIPPCHYPQAFKSAA